MRVFYWAEFMNKRAYSLIECKEFDDGERVLTGLATSPKIDRMGDSIDPFGVTAAADIPMFLYHDSTKTVGRVRLGKPTAKGIPFEARIAKISTAGALKDRVDEAWDLVRTGLITAVSVGFRVIDDAYEQIKGGGILFKKTEVLELSLVPVPAHPDALISGWKSMATDAQRDALLTAIKSIDTEQRAALIGIPKSVKLVVAPKEEAVISAVKSVDQKALSAIGHERTKSALEIRPGATGKKRRPIQLIPRK